MNVIRNHRRSSKYHLSSGVVRVESLGGGAKQGCTREGARGKTGDSIGGKLQNGGDAGGQSVDLLLDSVSPSKGESIMHYETLNEDNTNARAAHIPICWISTEWTVDLSYKIKI